MIPERIIKENLTPQTCHDCGAVPGEFHKPGCDVARCPRCGGQEISCDCVYVVNGMDPATLEDSHPDIYHNGATDEMCAKFEKEWGPKRKPWDGIWPGVRECVEYGLYAYFGPDWDGGRGWIRCGPEHPGATPHLNDLVWLGRWDADRQRFVIPGRTPALDAEEIEELYTELGLGG